MVIIFFTEFLFSSQNLDLNGMREKPFIGTAINNVQQSIGHFKKGEIIFFPPNAIV